MSNSKEDKKKDKTYIGQAISFCKESNETNLERANKLLFAIILIAITMLGIIIYLFFILEKSLPTEMVYLIYIVFAVLIITLSLISILYRYNLKEASKMREHLIDFHRIKIAAMGGVEDKYDYQTEVRTALTKNTFYVHPKGSLFGKKETKEETPHLPAIEITNKLLDGILNNINIIVKNAITNINNTK